MNCFTLPRNSICYGTHTFNAKQAAGFTKRHSTKEGTWGSLKVSSGELDLIFLASEGRELTRVTLNAGSQNQIIPPGLLHRLEAKTPDFSIELGFHCKLEHYFSKKYGNKQPHYDVLAFAKEYLPSKGENMSLLDIGCGTGRNSLYFAKLGYNVLGLDRNDSALDQLESLSTKDKLYNLSVKNMDLNFLSTERLINTYDVVLSTVSLQFLDPCKVQDLIEYLQSITKSNGYHHLIFPIQEDPFEFPENFSYLAKRDELYQFYQESGWSIAKYKESIGNLSRNGKDGKPIQGYFGELISQKV